MTRAQVARTFSDICHVYLGLMAISVFLLCLAVAGATTRHDIGQFWPTEINYDNGTVHLGGWLGWETFKYIERNQEHIHTVVLNSKGGKMDAGAKVAAILRDRGITTIVESGSICASTCTIMFQGGSERFAAKDATFLYHAPFLQATLTKFGLKWFGITVEKSTTDKIFFPEIAKKFFHNFVGYGMTEEFVDSIPMDREGEVTGTVAELYENGDIGLVTKFLN